MAHNVTERDGIFTVREAAWHNLQDMVFADHPTREEAQRIAHPWEPVSEPIYRRVPIIGEDGTLSHEYREVPGFVATVRDDEVALGGDATLGIVSTSHELVSNGTMYDIAEAIEGLEPGSVKYETGGSLKGGKKVWLLLRLTEPIWIKGDPNGATIPYFAMQNAHDGSGSFRGQGIGTRIVCDNTALASDLEAQANRTEFTFRHTASIHDRVEQAKQALAGWREDIAAYQRTMELLVDAPITADQQAEFIERFIPMPPPHSASNRVMENVSTARHQMRQILASPTCADIDLTAYGLVQASIEYNQHARATRSAETRFRRAYLDRSQITTDAVELAREIARV